MFRFPPQRNLFCAFVGTGTQLLGLAVAIFGLACMNLFYPYNRWAAVVVPERESCRVPRRRKGVSSSVIDLYRLPLLSVSGRPAAGVVLMLTSYGC